MAAAVHQAAEAVVGQENEEQQQQPGLVQGTLSSPRLTRQLSIRSKLLYTAIQEVRVSQDGRRWLMDNGWPMHGGWT